MPRIVTASRSCSDALRILALPDQNEFRVGRRDPRHPTMRPEADLFPDSHVSRQHCRVRHHGATWSIEDIGSTDGTFVNGRDIGKQCVVELPPGAEVRTGETHWILVPDDWLLTASGTLVVFGPVSRQVSYAAYHCGTPVVGELHARNLGDTAAGPHTVSFRIPDYSDTCRLHIPPLAPHVSTVLGNPGMRLHGDTLRRLIGAVRSRLIVAVDDVERSESSSDVAVLGMWDWSHAAAARRTVAAFVSPHDPAIVALMRGAANRLAQEESIDSFDILLASGRMDAEQLILGVVYRSLADMSELLWEHPIVKTRFEGGPLYQSIRPPHQVLDSVTAGERKATCLDLSVLMASCLENCGICPLILFVEDEDGAPSHAFVGCWAGTVPGERPVIRDSPFLLAEVQAGSLFLCECTGVLDRGPNRPRLSFEQAIESATLELKKARSVSAVDIRALRPPLGPITAMDCTLAPEVAIAYDQAVALAREKNREAIETGYLLYGLLAAKGAVTAAVLGTFMADPEEKRRSFRDGIRRRAHVVEAQPTWNYLECRRLAEAYAWHAASPTVREQDLWWALLDRGAQSSSLASALRLVGFSYPELRAILMQRFPRPDRDDGGPFLASKPWSTLGGSDR